MPTPSFALSPALAQLAARVQSGRQSATPRSSVSPGVASPLSSASVSNRSGSPALDSSVAPVLPSGLLSAFLTQASSLSLRQSRPAWLKERIAQRDGNRCWHCGTRATCTASLFSRALGGHASDDNTVCACPACIQRFTDLDPMVDHWCNPASPWSKEQNAQRLRALAESLNHGLPVALAGSARAAWASLEKLRWGQPRVACAVFHGEAITLLTPIAKPEASWSCLARGAKEAGATVEATRAEVLVVDSDQWEHVAHMLIQAGALLRRVSVPGFLEAVASPVDGVSNPRGGFRWDELFQGTRAVARAAKGA
ncbi:MAG: hypothetical protein RSP_17910 [Rhodanobacter sp.]